MIIRLKDFYDLERFDTDIEPAKPFKPFEQLLLVLPPGSKELLPKSYQKLMTDPKFSKFYLTEFECDLNGKKQEWEAVIKIPFIEEKNLLNELNCEH